MYRGAIVTTLLLLAPALAAAQPHGPADARLARARALEARVDHTGAAAAYEAYARACLASSTALLEEGRPCAATGDALLRAFALRRALGDAEAADADAEAFLAHFLYARPRQAIRVAHDRVRMHLEAGRPDRAADALERFESAHPDPPSGQSIVTDALRARIAVARDRSDRAATYWRRVERRWDRLRDELDPEGPVPLAWVREAVAEGRLWRAEARVERFLATRPPRARRIRDDRRWWRQTMSPWLVRTRRRLLLARMALERVYELGSPRHSVIAAARIGEMYAHQAELHASLTLPEGEWIRVLVQQGSDRPGYEQARQHLETCVRWSEHHDVASGWADRCEQDLHHLDPHRYPDAPAELHGAAVYRPAAHAMPAEPR